MELIFENEFNDSFNTYEDLFLSLMGITKEALKLHSNYEVDVYLVDDQKIHQINKEYRNIDRTTDVISFAFLDHVDGEVTIKNQDVVMLGEIIISCEKAIAQAKEYGHSINREMGFLFVHGLLHLLGYDHMKMEDEKIMFDLQKKILELGGLTK